MKKQANLKFFEAKDHVTQNSKNTRLLNHDDDRLLKRVMIYKFPFDYLLMK